jgi:hypothetical protein
MNWFQASGSAPSKVILIPLFIFISKELEVLFRFAGIEIASPSDSDNWFIANFIEWFGVLYGILLPLILVRAWEQLDAIDREFDREADTVKVLYKDLLYFSKLPLNTARIGREIANLLHDYVRHVRSKYQNERKKEGSDKKAGDTILEQIGEKFEGIIQNDLLEAKVSEFLIRELFQKLNKIIDIRGDRISLASQRIFESLRTVALITSIIFLIPFYFAGLTSIYLLDLALIVSVTFLVIYIYMIIEDLDDPFDGPKSISDESWRFLLEEMDSERKKREQNLLEELSVNNSALRTPVRTKGKPKSKRATTTSSSPQTRPRRKT